MFLDVTTDAGEVEPVRIETFGGPWAFEQAGVTSEMFPIGDRLRVAGRVSTRRDGYFLGTNALLASGTEVLMGVGFGRHWEDGPVVGGATQFSGNNPVPVDAASENLGFFRVWSIPDRGDGTPQSEAVLFQGGIEVFDRDGRVLLLPHARDCEMNGRRYFLLVLHRRFRTLHELEH